METRDNRAKSITLTVTEKCDLACIYCYEHKKTARDMDLMTAQSIIDREFSDHSADSFMIEFFGGEPFLNFPLIKAVVDYIGKTYSEIPVHYFISSNGTHVHGEIQQWLITHSDSVTVGLSFDGTKRVQDMNRSGSFDKIDLLFFRKMYPMQPVKMTVSKNSLPYLSESIAFLHEQGFKIACNLAYMVDWTSAECVHILQEQLELLIQYYIDHPQLEKCSMLNYDISILGHPKANQEYVKKFCGCGTDMHVYSVDGICYPCQLFSPISASEKAIKSCDFHLKREIPRECYPAMCNDCYYERLCAFCLGSNYLSTGNMFMPDAKRCELNKVIFRANAKLQAMEWGNGVAFEDEQGLLKSVTDILGL